MRTVGRASWVRIVMPLVLIALVASLGAAGASSRSGQINACIGPAGYVRVVRDGVQCRHNERPLVWNVQGPAGPPGPSLLNVTLREQTKIVTAPPTDPSGASVDAAAFCRAGEVVVGGGVTSSDLGLGKLTLASMGPIFDGTNSGWFVSWVNKGTDPVTGSVTVAAECVPGTMTSGTSGP